MAPTVSPLIQALVTFSGTIICAWKDDFEKAVYARRAAFLYTGWSSGDDELDGVALLSVELCVAPATCMQ